MKKIAILAMILLSGCSDLTQEKHVINENRTERGVEIEVMLKGGGSAILVCPKFSGKPAGEHGRECYLREYDLEEPLSESDQEATKE